MPREKPILDRITRFSNVSLEMVVFELDNNMPSGAQHGSIVNHATGRGDTKVICYITLQIHRNCENADLPSVV